MLGLLAILAMETEVELPSISHAMCIPSFRTVVLPAMAQMPKREKQISAWIRKASSPHLPVKENDWFNQGRRLQHPTCHPFEDPDSVMPPPESS